jgi:hypothetical protein
MNCREGSRNNSTSRHHRLRAPDTRVNSIINPTLPINQSSTTRFTTTVKYHPLHPASRLTILAHLNSSNLTRLAHFTNSNHTRLAHLTSSNHTRLAHLTSSNHTRLAHFTSSNHTRLAHLNSSNLTRHMRHHLHRRRHHIRAMEESTILRHRLSPLCPSTIK